MIKRRTRLRIYIKKERRKEDHRIPYSVADNIHEWRRFRADSEYRAKVTV